MIADKGRFALHASSKAENTAVYYRGSAGLARKVGGPDDEIVRSGIVSILDPVTVGGDSLQCFVVDVRSA